MIHKRVCGSDNEDSVDHSQDRIKTNLKHEYLVIGWVEDKWDMHLHIGGCVKASRL